MPLLISAAATCLLFATGFVEFLRSELYGVSPSDPLTIVRVSATLALTAALAGWQVPPTFQWDYSIKKIVADVSNE